MLAIDSPRARRLIGLGWLVFASVNATLMYLVPGEETIPYHLIWASFAYLYGLVVWPRAITWPVFAGITVITGGALLRHAISGYIGWEECSEIVLMGVIAALLVWHVNRHQAARLRIAELLEAERIRAGNRELATRFGSHELRTRLTIARGFIDLIREATPDAQTQSDAELAIAELDKATALATGLMTLVRVDASLPLAAQDLDDLVDAIAHRWAARTDREWVISATAGSIRCHVERFEAAIDCLVENAVKFTADGDQISIDARRDRSDVVVTVADCGVGIPPEDLGLVTDLFHTSSNAGERAGSGLGLPIVRAAVEARGGTLSIESTLGSGTAVTFRIPLHESATPDRDFYVHPATSQTVHAATLGRITTKGITPVEPAV
jgi:signal transduction histidine kinase